jgi:RNA-directed DNA polymerase
MSKGPRSPGNAFHNIVYGQLSFVKMVRGPSDPVFLKLCARVLDLDPNPSKFIRQMVYGADDFDVFLSHASEDKAEIARPIFEACQKAGLKAFLDQEHIGWGESFTNKINTALGAARTVLVIVSSNSVSKDWPLAEINTALAFEVERKKRVVALLVGNPDLSKLPLIKAKKYLIWNGDPAPVVLALKAANRAGAKQKVERQRPEARTLQNPGKYVPQIGLRQMREPRSGAQRLEPGRGFLKRLFGIP